ncbi:PrgI family protein [Bariatricus sp. HCP28S3_C2]|uniref:PrgI family protein n=1 Tax=unclassified Bariatricus TaxID=2677046 RepID=UPI003F89688A
MAASYISVPRDLTKVKSKVMFNLTKRQLICFGLAALIGVPSFFLLKTVVKVNTAVMGMMVIMMPFFFLAMYEKNGQPLEVILSHMIQAIFKRPKIRPYMTDNYYAALMRQAKAEKEVENIVRHSQKEESGKKKVHHAGGINKGRAESCKENRKKCPEK